MTTNETAFSQAKAVIPGGVDSPVRAFGGVGSVSVSVGAPKDRPREAASWTAATTSGCA